ATTTLVLLSNKDIASLIIPSQNVGDVGINQGIYIFPFVVKFFCLYFKLSVVLRLMSHVTLQAHFDFSLLNHVESCCDRASINKDNASKDTRAIQEDMGVYELGRTKASIPKELTQQGLMHPPNNMVNPCKRPTLFASKKLSYFFCAAGLYMRNKKWLMIQHF
ncbi:hypothetical protein ACJX0J_034440, partial [Zea mays]